VLQRLETCLVELDRLGVGMPAAQLDLAIQRLRDAIDQPARMVGELGIEWRGVA
jgi:hypothetical protein